MKITGTLHESGRRIPNGRLLCPESNARISAANCDPFFCGHFVEMEKSRECLIVTCAFRSVDLPE